MIIALAFIITSVFQYYSYYRNNKKEKKVDDFLITIVVILIYILIYPFLGYILLTKYNHYNMPYTFQVIIIGGIGIFFALITYLFWYLEKRKLA
ncbi:hypothetical protein MK851_07005 [Tenacibaculum sp. 1B UA]|uniref:hypothetical protein n=1 Tax=Tenacibaculum sp. 1B UA TaxID=2922252 RepID=UPI002A24E491|nr:hypothetical protein [Tenacibaculum sp. 1B UA]MDX8553376.1 hypothetical protein [Tenacibaculum sp. 1B UA]